MSEEAKERKGVLEKEVEEEEGGEEKEEEEEGKVEEKEEEILCDLKMSSSPTKTRNHGLHDVMDDSSTSFPKELSRARSIYGSIQWCSYCQGVGVWKGISRISTSSAAEEEGSEEAESSLGVKTA